jgi:hypothetical protein
VVARSKDQAALEAASTAAGWSFQTASTNRDWGVTVLSPDSPFPTSGDQP